MSSISSKTQPELIECSKARRLELSTVVMGNTKVGYGVYIYELKKSQELSTTLLGRQYLKNTYSRVNQRCIGRIEDHNREGMVIYYDWFLEEYPSLRKYQLYRIEGKSILIPSDDVKFVPFTNKKFSKRKEAYENFTPHLDENAQVENLTNHHANLFPFAKGQIIEDVSDIQGNLTLVSELGKVPAISHSKEYLSENLVNNFIAQPDAPMPNTISLGKKNEHIKTKYNRGHGDNKLNMQLNEFQDESFTEIKTLSDGSEIESNPEFITFCKDLDRYLAYVGQYSLNGLSHETIKNDIVLPFLNTLGFTSKAALCTSNALPYLECNYKLTFASHRINDDCFIVDYLIKDAQDNPSILFLIVDSNNELENIKADIKRAESFIFSSLEPAPTTFILTDGFSYNLHQIIDKKLAIELKPFLSFELSKLNLNIRKLIFKLTKNNFYPKEAIVDALTCKVSHMFTMVLNSQINAPDKALLSFFMKKCNMDGAVEDTNFYKEILVKVLQQNYIN